MKGSVFPILKWGLALTLAILLVAIILINFTSSRDLPELVRVPVSYTHLTLPTTPYV